MKTFAVLHDCLLYDNEKNELKIVTVFFYYLASFFFLTVHSWHFEKAVEGIPNVS